MINSKPNNPGKYNQGNYIPINKDKVLKLNDEGGVYFRSSWEKRIMVWLDTKNEIVKWGAECIKIPYQLTEVVDGDFKIKTRSYYPDFYYEIKTGDSIKQVVVEVKPQKDYEDAVLFEKGGFNIQENLTLKKIKGLEYRFKTAQKNYKKWETMIKWCEKKGFEFIIITELSLKKFNL